MNKLFKFIEQKSNNDNNSPIPTYECGNDGITGFTLYKMNDGRIKIFPNFRMERTSKNKNGLINVFYKTGTIRIKGQNMEELFKLLIFNKIATLRITPPSITEKNNFRVDEITFEDKKS